MDPYSCISRTQLALQATAEAQQQQASDLRAAIEAAQLEHRRALEDQEAELQRLNNDNYALEEQLEMVTANLELYTTQKQKLEADLNRSQQVCLGLELLPVPLVIGAGYPVADN